MNPEQSPAPVAAPPVRGGWRNDSVLQQIIALALLLAGLLFGRFLLDISTTVIVGLWAILVLNNSARDVADVPPRDFWLICMLVVGILISAALVGAAWIGGLLAPAVVILLALLLPRQDTTLAAAEWGLAVTKVLWAVIGAGGLLLLLALHVPLGSAIIPVLGGLIAYNAGRRAGAMQGQSDRVAIGIGLVLALMGAILLGPSGAQGIFLVVGLVAGLLAANAAPAPPPGPRPDSTALLATHQQIVFTAPLVAALLWLAQTFLT